MTARSVDSPWELQAEVPRATKYVDVSKGQRWFLEFCSFANLFSISATAKHVFLFLPFAPCYTCRYSLWFTSCDVINLWSFSLQVVAVDGWEAPLHFLLPILHFLYRWIGTDVQFSKTKEGNVKAIHWNMQVKIYVYIRVTPVKQVSWVSSNWWISDKCKNEIT